MNKTSGYLHIGGICLLLFAILSAVWQVAAKPLGGAEGAVSEYEMRKTELASRAGGPYMPDPNEMPLTALDQRTFSELNAMACPFVLDNPDGWSVEARAGGRPFMSFNNIEVITETRDTWPIIPCTPSSSGIPPAEITAHYLQKGPNRFWITHKASNGKPIVVVMTADGFYNPSGIDIPMRQGAALRTGFIGDPFSVNDYLQHAENVLFEEVDKETLLITVDLISEAGEGVLLLELTWDVEKEVPILTFRSAHMVRTNLPITSPTLGFTGFNFMRGPTLHGLKSEGGTPNEGIEAFHDARTAFLRTGGKTTRILLTPPVLTTTVFIETVSDQLSPNAKLIIDQPQYMTDYFSKHPENSDYEYRADFMMTLTRSSISPLQLRRFQTAVPLTEDNPEANETVNLFFAVAMQKETLYEFSYVVEVNAYSFEEQLTERFSGVVFVSDRAEGVTKLYYLQLDGFAPAGDPIPLTDGVISDTRRPAASTNGRYIIFDADTYKPFLPANSDNSRIHILDLLSGSVYRATVDPFGSSEDWNGRFSPDGTEFAFLSNRTGQTYLNIWPVSAGLGSGSGSSEILATGVDWCSKQDELAYVNASGLWLLDSATHETTAVVMGSGLADPRFSPDCSKIAYTTTSGVFVVAKDGSGNVQIVANSSYPAWIDENNLIVQQTVGGNKDLYVYELATMTQVSRLTTNSASDMEPVFVSGYHVVDLPLITR